VYYKNGKTVKPCYSEPNQVWIRATHQRLSPSLAEAPTITNQDRIDLYYNLRKSAKLGTLDSRLHKT